MLASKSVHCMHSAQQQCGARCCDLGISKGHSDKKGHTVMLARASGRMLARASDCMRPPYACAWGFASWRTWRAMSGGYGQG